MNTTPINLQEEYAKTEIAKILNLLNEELVGLAHGYFLIGPFATLGPLRNSEIALLSGFLSTIGLIVILTIGLTIYGVAAFGQEKSSGNSNDLQTKKAWDEFKGGFFIGACGSAGFAFICLSSIPSFTS